MSITFCAFLTAFAALPVYAALLATKRKTFPADGCQVAPDPKPIALASPLNGPQNRVSGVSLEPDKDGADKRCGEFLTAGGANREADKVDSYQGGNSSLHRPPLSRSLSTPQCSTGTSQSRPFPARPGKIMESAGHITKPRPTASVELSQLESSEGATSGTIVPTLNRRAHNLGRWLAISPTFNFPASDSHLGSSERKPQVPL